MAEAQMSKTTMVVMSGGLDSTVALWSVLPEGGDIRGISFDYGQRHRVELERAEQIAHRAGIPWSVVDMSGVASLFTGSALTNRSVSVPRKPYDGPTMDVTVVPMRNAMMISIAAGAVASCGGGTVVAGMHGADHALYPDCRPEFVVAMQETIDRSLDGVRVSLVVPFLTIDKSEIVRRGADLGAPLDLTWSCYEGGGVQCGQCGTCRERRRAFADAGVPDPTVYRGQSVFCTGDD